MLGWGWGLARGGGWGTRVHSGADPGWHGPGPRVWTRPCLRVSSRLHDPRPRRSGRRSLALPLTEAVPASSQTTSQSQAPTQPGLQAQRHAFQTLLLRAGLRVWLGRRQASPPSSGPYHLGPAGLSGGFLRCLWGARHSRQGYDSASGLGSATGPNACTLPQGTQKSRKVTLLRGRGLRQLLPQESDPPGDGGASQTMGPLFPGAWEDWPKAQLDCTQAATQSASLTGPTRPPRVKGPQDWVPRLGEEASGLRAPGLCFAPSLGARRPSPPSCLSLLPSLWAARCLGEEVLTASQGQGCHPSPRAWLEAQGPRGTVRGIRASWHPDGHWGIMGP